MEAKLRIGALISGGGSNLQAIIDACEGGRVGGRVVFVGADSPGAKGLGRAKKHGIPTFVVDYGEVIRDFRGASAPLPPVDFDLQEVRAKQSLFSDTRDPERIARFLCSRAVAESQLLAAMADFDFELLVLAGFMRNLTPYFIDRVNTVPGEPRIMNIHPALLPAFPGVDGYGDTFRYGCKVGGCTVHFIDYGEDTGPIIGQKSFAITPQDTEDSVREKGLALEWQLYPECIQLFAEGRLKTVKLTYALPDGRTVQRSVVKIGV
ncbi:MAG: phosphoribosylglycinamide formyltransferase [Desulfobacterales bacterium]